MRGKPRFSSARTLDDHDIMNGSAPEVTWLLPVRNGMPYLTETLASLAAQTYRRYRVLALDDGSTDDSFSELTRWIPARLPGRIISLRTSVGLGAALARLVEEADTEWCARIDADDLCEPQRLEHQVAFVQSNPQVAVVGTQIQFIDSSGRSIDGAWTMPTNDADIRWRLRFCNALNHPTVMFRRSAVLRAGNYRPMQPGQDYDLWVRLAPHCRMANLPQALVRYRRHSSSITARENRAEHQVPAELFPDLSRDQISRLFTVVTNWNNENISLEDIRLLRRAATNASIEAGQANDYFRRTELYRCQHRSLVRRWMRCLLTNAPIRNAA